MFLMSEVPMALCLETYGGPREVGASYKRGTPGSHHPGDARPTVQGYLAHKKHPPP